MSEETRRQRLFREVNVRICEVSANLGLDRYILFCECRRADCEERTEVPALEFEQVVENGEFFTLPSHGV